MKKYFILLTALLVVSMAAFAAVSKKKANRDTERFRYEIECAGNGVQGTYLVKVWSYSKRPQVAYEQAAKNAVHGVIFKGFTGSNGCVGQQPLARNAGVETEYEDYFAHFFADNGEYYKYVSLVEGTFEYVQVGREYKVGVIVSVKKDELRAALEAAGVIRGLNYGF